MELGTLLTPEAVLPSLAATSKKQALQILSDRAADLTGLPVRDILHSLMERERLGSTGVGGGVALPHARIPGITRVYGLFARLPNSVEFEAPDGQKVDLVFVLLAPVSANAEHLRALARVSRLLRNREFCAKLRAAMDTTSIYTLLVNTPGNAEPQTH